MGVALGVKGSFLHYAKLLWDLGISYNLSDLQFLSVTELPVEGTDEVDYLLSVDTHGIHYIASTDVRNTPSITVRYNRGNSLDLSQEREFLSADRALSFVYTNTKRRLGAVLGKN